MPINIPKFSSSRSFGSGVSGAPRLPSFGKSSISPGMRPQKPLTSINRASSSTSRPIASIHDVQRPLSSVSQTSQTANQARYSVADTRSAAQIQDQARHAYAQRRAALQADQLKVILQIFLWEGQVKLFEIKE